MGHMNARRQFLLNLTASLITFTANLGIGFLLTPFIVQRVGAEAYGFVGLANNMVNYATLFTLALNSVAGRFITVAWHQGDKALADRYFTSTLSSNMVIVAVLAIVSVPLVINLDRIVNISPHLVADVKALFAFIIVNFLMSTISTVFTVATFIKNKLYLSSIANIIAIGMKMTALVVLFGTLPARVTYVGVGTCLSTAVILGLNWCYTRRLVPQLRFVRSGFSWDAVRHMLAAGVWNCVVKVQQILQNGLSLLLANVMISPYLMGLLSIAQTVPLAITGLIGMVTSLFQPEQTRCYAQRDHEGLMRELAAAMRLGGMTANMVFVVLFMVGEDFIRLWQPGLDAHTINLLMQLTMSGFCLAGMAGVMQSVPLLVNRLRTSSLAWLVSGIVSFAATLLTVWLAPGIGIYAIAAIAPVADIIVNLTFVPVYAALCLRLRWYVFYSYYGQYLGATTLAAGCCFALRALVMPAVGSWAMLFAQCVAYALIVFVVDVVLLLGRHERNVIRGMAVAVLRLRG